jgi:lipoprotein-anchoring transpeptidase ErfK/SrfK
MFLNLSRLRLLLAVAALLLAAGPVAAASAQDGSDPAAPPVSAPGPEDADEEEPDPLWPIAAPSKAKGATVARVVVATNARLQLSSAKRFKRVGTQTAWSKQTQTLLVLDGAEHGGERWVKVLLGTRPNGRTAWIKRDHVVLSATRWWIDVSTRLRRVTVFRDGRRVRSFRAVVGARRTPTPHTLSAVYEINRQPNPKAFLGTWVVALTSHSNVLENYGGGPGRVAIHGRAGASLRDPLGSARSHGCVRVTNADVGFLAKRIPPGTPVDLRK